MCIYMCIYIYIYIYTYVLMYIHTHTTPHVISSTVCQPLSSHLWRAKGFRTQLRRRRGAAAPVAAGLSALEERTRDREEGRERGTEGERMREGERERGRDLP